MRICLKCLSACADHATYCSGCGGSFGGTRCTSGHLSPGLRPYRFCTVCRSTELTAAVPSLSTKTLNLLLSWLIALALLRWSFGHLSEGEHFGMWAMSWLLGTRLFGEIHSLLVLALMLWVVVWFVGLFSPETAKRFDLLSKVLPWLVKGLWWLARNVFKLMLLLVRGTQAQGKGERRGSSAKEEVPGAKPIRIK